MVVKIKEELFFITEQTLGGAGAAGIVGSWWDNYRYQVPQDRKYIFRPGHTFSAAFNNSTGAPAANVPAGQNPIRVAGEIIQTSRIRIQLRNADENQYINLLQDTIYALVRHFADRDLIRRLDIVKEVEATAGMWIVIMIQQALGDVIFDPTDVDSYFSLTADIVRQTIM